MKIRFNSVLESFGNSGEIVVREFGAWSSSRFKQMEASGLARPVLITALDEEDDVTTCLLSLARQSAPVLPVIVDNASSDRTAEFALTMGAEIVEEPIQTKIRALITGLGYICSTYAPGSILFTDADTAFGAKWAEIMGLNAGKTDAGIETRIGTAIYHNIGAQEGSMAVDSLRSLRSVFQTVRFPDRTSGRGHNMGLWYSDNLHLSELIRRINPERITRNDTHLVEQAVALGGVKIACLDPRASAFTRGDRMPDFSTFTRALLSRRFRTVDSYQDWYDRADLINKEGPENLTANPADY